jgi:small subunit ribosomal protein S17
MTTKKTQTTPATRRRLTGTVISTKMTKTVSVQVDRTVLHEKYQKRYAVSKKYLVHNEIEGIVAGDKVIIEETRPLSAKKRWRVVAKA